MDETDLIVWVRNLPPNPTLANAAMVAVEIDRRNESDSLLVRNFMDLTRAEAFARELAKKIDCDCYNCDTGTKYV